ncbi:MAG TPA: FAD-dependent oxidoreductase, partial [Solirubrobacteraceae bacterium]|nr:FAD-dependent oxidoreductase [Solirubrobacteraceae bacterium]
MASTQRESFDVAVIGGGAIGLAIAWRAAQRGLDVCVFDGDRARGACNVAAGMLAPVTEARLGERPLLDLGLESARRWPAFAKELAAATGEPLGYTRCGTLLLARDRDEVEALERERDVRLALGLQVHRLRPSEARALVPALAPGAVRLALAIADDHAVDPRRLGRALSAAAILAGASLRETDVSELICEQGRVSGVLLADRR